ncbi:MAG: YbaY family lipoprotein [Trueperaceae bacterium]|nr:YbaY family lipoprotein [Trueperaceae bacterium]
MYLRDARILIIGLAALGAMLGAAGAQQPVDATSLTGTTWRWDFQDEPNKATNILSPNQTILFEPDGSYFAQADCNSVRGGYSAQEDGSIDITPGPSTLVWCGEGTLGDEFMRLLDRVISYSLSPLGDLVLHLDDETGTLTLRALHEVTGTVIYLPRVALPDDVTVTVTLEDVSLADAPSVELGRHTFYPQGAQVPLRFSVSYLAQAIGESGRYTIRVRITDPDGTLLWVSDTSTPVITGGNPTSDVEVRVVQP